MTVIGDNAFNKCYNITGIVIPYGVVSLGRNAFENCSADWVRIPDSVTDIDAPFADRHTASDFYIECYIDSQIWHYADNCMINTRTMTFEDLPDNDGVLRYKYNHSGAVVCGKYDKTAEHIVIPDYIGGMPVVSIVGGAFYDGVTKSITFPSTLKYIRDDVSLSGGESGEIILPDGLEYIGNMAFSGLGVKKVYIPSSVTFIGEYAFNQCINAVIFGEEGSLAEEYAKQHDIPFNEDEPEPSYLVYEINDGEATLTGCTLPFGTIDIPETLGGCPVTKIADGVFKEFDQLGGVILPDTVKEIGDEAFAGCFNLRDFVIPDSVVSIGDRAIEGDFQLATVTAGAGITHIGENAFSGCAVLILYCKAGSYALRYAVANSVNHVVVSDKPKPYVPGDCNGDGGINLSDVTLLLQHIAKWDVVLHTLAADVNVDDSISLSDVTLLLQYIAGWNVTLG